MPPLRDIDFRLALANGCTDLAGNLFDGHHPEEALAFCHCSIDKAGAYICDDDFSASFESLFAQGFHIVNLIGLSRAVGRRHRFTTQSSCRRNGNEMAVQLLLKQMESTLVKSWMALSTSPCLVMSAIG